LTLAVEARFTEMDRYVAWLARLGLGALLCRLGLSKLDAVGIIAEYCSARFGTHPEVSSLLAYGIAGLEITMGLAVVMAPFGGGLSRAASAVVLALGVATGALALTDHPEIKCGCFGREEATQGRRLIVSGAIAFLALHVWSLGRWGAVGSPQTGRLSTGRRPISWTQATGVALSVTLGGWALLTSGHHATTGSEGLRPSVPHTDESTAPAPAPLLEGRQSPGAAIRGTTTTDPGAREVSGRTIAASDGSPVAGVILAAGDESGPLLDGPRSVSNAEGHFRLSIALDQGVWAVATGFRVARVPAIHPHPDGQLVIALERGAAIAGLVLDHTGRAVMDAQVFASPEANRAYWPLSKARLYPGLDAGNQARTDESGRFEITGLSETTAYEIRATKQGWEQEYDAFPPLAIPGSREELKLRLLPTAELVVRVLSSVDESDVSLCRIEVLHSHGLELTGSERQFDLEPADEQTLTSRVFRYRTTSPTKGSPPSPSARVVISAPGFAEYSQDVRLQLSGVSTHVARLVPSADRSRGQIRLRASYAGGTAFSGPLGVFVGSPGVPVCGLYVRFSRGEASRTLDLPPGEYVLRPVGVGAAGEWWSSPGKPVRVRVERDGSQTVTFALEGTPVLVQVEDSLGRVMHGYDLRLETSGRAMGYNSHWDLNIARSPAVDLGTERPASTVLWLPPGAHVLTVNVPGVGMKSLPCNSGAEGTPIPLRFVVAVGPWLNLRERAARVRSGSLR
jgi:hypothetical protein